MFAYQKGTDNMWPQDCHSLDLELLHSNELIDSDCRTYLHAELEWRYRRRCLVDRTIDQ
jgi:hypothetical protein